MRPGPDLIYKCPYCGNYLRKRSLLSGNTIGATRYSDGKRVAPMLTDFPDLTKCKKCDNIFWLSKMDDIGECYCVKWDEEMPIVWKGVDNEEVPIEWKGSEEAEFLDIKDLFRALKVVKDRDEEETIRIWIWWAFNDRIRNGGKEMFVNESEISMWEDNCLKLLSLLDVNNFTEKLMFAEIYRNLGKFEDCIEIIDSITENSLTWIKDQMKYMAKKQFTFVFPYQELYISNNRYKYPYFQERGELKEKQGNYKSALEDYEKAIIVDDMNSLFYVFRGGAYEKLRNFDLALDNFNKSLSIEPNNPQAYINRALFYRRRKLYSLAQSDYEKAISFEPNNFNIVSFDEVDIFKYGKFSSIIDSKFPPAVFKKFKEGTLIIDVFLSYNRKSETDTTLWLDPKKIPYFIFRKVRQKSILNKKFINFEFQLARIISYLRVCIFRRKPRFINNAVLN